LVRNREFIGNLRRDRKSGSRLFYWSEMKKKSRTYFEQTRQNAPLVRGPLKTKEKGELAELAFLHKAASLGFGVAQPHGDSERPPQITLALLGHDVRHDARIDRHSR
jgi:hypothetical protein